MKPPIKKRRFRLTLVTLMVAFATIPLLLLAIPVGSYLFEATKNSAKKELALVAESKAERLQLELRLLEKDSLALSLDSDIHRSVTSTLFVERSDVVLEDFIRRNPIAKALFVFNLKGEMITAMPVQMSSITPPKEVISGGLDFISRTPRPQQPKVNIEKNPEHLRLISPGPNKSEYVVSIVVPVVGLLNRVTGMILIQFGVDDLMTALPPEPDSPTQITLWMGNQALWKSKNGVPDQYITSPIGVFNSAPHEDLKALGLSVAEPITVRFAPIRRWMIGLTIGATLIVLLLALVAWKLALSLTKALPKLMDLIHAYQQGQYSTPQPQFSFIEFSELGDTLHLMSQSILANIDAIKEKERLKGELYRTQIEFQIDTLKKQMSPHFLFNALNSVAMLIQLDGPRSQKMVGKLADLYRLILEASKSPTIPLSHELQIVEAYLDLEQLRFGKRLSYSLDLKECPKDLPFPGLLLQTLVENAVKHGIAKSRDGGMITLSIWRVRDGFYELSIANSGAPYQEKSSPTKNSGTGLKNTIERLTLLYGEGHGFTIQSINQQTVVRFVVSEQPQLNH